MNKSPLGTNRREALLGIIEPPRERERERENKMTSSMFNKEKWLPMVYLPFRISHYCCRVMKKQPLHKYQTRNGCYPILGTMAEESRVRKQGWIRTGCNAFKGKESKSQPMSFWTEQDVLQYIDKFDIKISSVYGDIIKDAKGKYKTTGVDRTGCTFCGYGFHLEKEPTRFQLLKETHPKQYNFAMNGGQWIDNPDYDPDAPEYDGIWKNWNPEKIWVPGNGGLGFRKVFEMCNEVYGDGFYKYE